MKNIVLFFCTITMLLGTVDITLAIPINSLVAYYSFSGNANDNSGNGYNGTVHGATLTTDRFGNANSAYLFNGFNNYISAGVNINPSAMPQLTMGAWVKAVNGNPIRQIISHDNGGYDRTLGIDFRGGGTGWSAFSGSGGVLGYKPVTLNSWVFVAVVYNQGISNVRLYVDGNTYSESGILGNGWNSLRIGSNPSFGEYFGGMIDDVFIFNEALTNADLDDIRQNGINPVPEPTTILLLGFGLASLFFYRKKQSIKT